MTTSLVAPIVFLILLFSTLIAIISLYLVFPREMTRLQRELRSRLRNSVPLSHENRPWFWKGVGGSVGYLISGPIGLIAGVVFGHSIARDPGEQFTLSPIDEELLADTGELPPELALDEAQAVFYLTVFALAAKIPGQDYTAVAQRIEQFVAEDLRLDRQRRELAQNIFLAAHDSASTFRDYAQQFVRLFSGRPAVIEQMIEVLVELCCVDERAEACRFLFAEAVETFGLSVEKVERLKALTLPEQRDSLQVLGVHEETALDDVRQKYRKLVIEYHPERVISDGVASEFLQLADRRFQIIQAAYEELERSRRGAPEEQEELCKEF